MKKVYLIIPLMLLLLCSSCTTTYLRGFENEQLMTVSAGMTHEQVRQIFVDPPFYRRFNKDFEEWEYRKFVTSGWSVAVVRFVNGQVVSLNAFLEYPCDKQNPSNSLIPATSTGKDTSTGQVKVFVTPEGQHIHAVKAAPNVMVTSDGKHVHATELP